MATIEDEDTDIFYVKEDSGFCCRLCCGPIHPFKMNMSVGSIAGGAAVAKYERPTRCHAGNCKCCCFQEILAFDGVSHYQIGSVKETCYFCVPQYDVKDASGETKYHIAMPTCFYCLPYVCAEGCCRVPFYVYPKDNLENPIGKIVRRWNSLATQLIGVHRFSVEFPPGASSEDKAIIMGGTYLLNELYFKPGAR